MQAAAKCLVGSMNELFDAGVKDREIAAHKPLMADDLIARRGLTREAVVWAIQNDMTKGLSEPLIDSVIDDPEVPEDVRDKWKKEIKDNKKPYEKRTEQDKRAREYLKEKVSRIRPYRPR